MLVRAASLTARDAPRRALDELLVEPCECPQVGAIAAARRVELEKSCFVASGACILVRHSSRDLDPRALGRRQPAAVEREGQLAGEHVDRLDVAAMDVPRVGLRSGLAAVLGDADLVDVREQLDVQAGSFDHALRDADDGLARRPAAVLGRLVLLSRIARR